MSKTNQNLSYHTTQDSDIAKKFASNCVKYGVSIGRRQPMHTVHLDCIEEIVAAGLHPVIIIGSTNGADSPFYNPVNNPLNVDLQHKQITLAMQQANIQDYTVLELEDVGNMQRWVKELRETLEQHSFQADNVVIHYREKAEDKQNINQTAIKPLKEYQQVMNEYGIAVWESANRNLSFNTISSSHYREADVESDEFRKFSSYLIDADWYVNLVKQARADNPDRALLANIPLTSLDLTLQRLHQEKNIATSSILKNMVAKTMQETIEEIQRFCNIS